MELVSPIVFALFFLVGKTPKNAVMWFIFSLWIAHYINRAIIYPNRAKMNKESVPLIIVLFAAFFNLANGYLNGHYLGANSSLYATDWFTSWQFMAGLAIFLTGAFINIQSDNILMRLRQGGEKGYKIPQGGFFRWISCPNHFGEIVEWTGFAILCWNLPALSFAVWTASNLIPRAISHHRWYKENFTDYPRNRKAVIPGVL
jgi:3-oxo-5-alpha-steroid 4-dehydrogenase 1